MLLSPSYKPNDTHRLSRVTIACCRWVSSGWPPHADRAARESRKGSGKRGEGGEEKVSRYWVYRVESGVRGTQASFASLINGAVAFGDVISSIDISENRARARGSRGLSETGPNRPSRRPLDDSAVAGGGTWLQARLAGICTSGVFRRQLLAPLPRGSP